MAATLLKCIILAVLTSSALCDELDLEVRSGRILKMLRDAVNQSAADSLNLPANATSIRENITDTFSCENRTYGYYADVDNGCQVFHVCLPSQSVTGRNYTYRYSFICPAETVFNQEVLVCTRPRDSIPCEESPDYYDLNMEFGKLYRGDEKEKEDKVPKETEVVTVKGQKRQPIRRKQNIIVEELIKDAIKQLGEIEEIPEEKNAQIVEDNYAMPVNAVPEALGDSNESFDTNSRLGTERYLRSGRTLFRGTKRYRPEQ